MTIREGYQRQPLWQGPSRLLTVRTSQILPLNSLLDPNDDEGSGMNKLPQVGPVFLGHTAFSNDERAYEDHKGPDRTVLQYNHQHYDRWKAELRSLSLGSKAARDQLLAPGGFGENFAADSDRHDIFMDEHTVCVGDIIGIISPSDTLSAAIQITGPRNPCYKLNHRFGIKNMSQRAQESYRTGWLSRTHQQGFVQAGDNLMLLERPYPEWPVARVQYYMYKDPRNFDMIKDCIDTLGPILVGDIKRTLTNRLSKGVENWAGRLGISTKTLETFSTYRLTSKTTETKRVSTFVFTRTTRLAIDDVRLMTATPGSHVRLKLKVPAKVASIEIIRSYSILSGTTNTFTLAIALADTSRGGSTFLHTLKPGDIISASDVFANTFPLHLDAEKHVFLAGGIGITAFLDHIRYCREQKLDFELHYMVRHEHDIAFQDQLVSAGVENGGKMDASNNHIHLNRPSDGTSDCADPRSSGVQIYIHISSSNTRASIPAILARHACHANTHIYICGSSKLSGSVTEHAKSLNMAPHRLHFEQFSVDASGDPFSVELMDTKQVVDVPGELSMLEALQDAGIMVPSSCEAGNCGTCKVRFVGRVEHRGTALSEEEKEEEMLACVSRGVGRICIDW